MTQAFALLLSLAVEVPVLLGTYRLRGWGTASTWRVVSIGAAVTLLSHPLVWHGTRAMTPWIESFWWRAAITELGAWGFEAALLAWLLRLSAGRALGVSLAANGCSFGAGLVWVYWLRDLR